MKKTLLEPRPFDSLVKEDLLYLAARAESMAIEWLAEANLHARKAERYIDLAKVSRLNMATEALERAELWKSLSNYLTIEAGRK